MVKSIFITRELSPDSPLLQLQPKFRVFGNTLLDFTMVPVEGIPECEWLMFYSQRGVKFFVEQSPPFESWPKVAALGPKTAKTCQEYGLKVHFIGNGRAVETAEALALVARGDRLLFLRAKNSMKSIQQLLHGEVEVLEKVVYDNKIKTTGLSIPITDIVVFTSPLNAKAYFSKNIFSEDQLAIAIGPTTETALLNLGLTDVLRPTLISEESVVDLIQSL